MNCYHPCCCSCNTSRGQRPHSFTRHHARQTSDLPPSCVRHLGTEPQVVSRPSKRCPLVEARPQHRQPCKQPSGGSSHPAWPHNNRHPLRTIVIPYRHATPALMTQRAAAHQRTDHPHGSALSLRNHACVKATRATLRSRHVLAGSAAASQRNAAPLQHSSAWATAPTSSSWRAAGAAAAHVSAMRLPSRCQDLRTLCLRPRCLHKTWLLRRRLPCHKARLMQSRPG